ncbi:hypothetical protein IPM65_02960 [Candidatus Roizmanbacteria bacterium]|nr:MAG: hypothetical protein IPM65_02960 [Candidatus Roizmanbacteria bacterium]
MTASDKSGRNLYISIGACLENLVIASKFFGVYSHVKYHKNIKDDSVCEVYFNNLTGLIAKPNLRHKLLVKAILKRVTKRAFYHKRQVPKSIINALEKLSVHEHIKVNVLTTSEKLNQFTDITIKAIQSGYSDRAFRKELSQWINNNLSDRKEGIPGYSLNMPFIVSLLFPFLLRNINLSELVARINKKSLKTMSAVCIVTSATDTKRDWLEIGRISQRALLILTSKDLSTYITVAAVDIDNYYLEVQELLNTSWRPQFSFTFGYSNIVSKFPPRHSVDEKLI